MTAPSDIASLQTRARAGDVAALTALGMRLLTADGVRPSPPEGMAMLTDAEARGGAEAAARLALLAAWGLLRPRNLDEAFDLLARAASRGWVPAQEELRHLARGEGSDWPALRRAIDAAAWAQAPPARAAMESPRIRVFEGFASAAECDRLTALAKNNLKRAMVYRKDQAGRAVSEIRTNTEADLTFRASDIGLSLMRDRIAAAAGYPASHFEVTKLLHYDPGQQFHMHSDFIDTSSPGGAQDVARHGQRAVTFLVYLNDDFEGGETDFPKVNFRFKGRRGDALMFFNVLPSGEPDYLTVHAGLPPRTGVKWLLSQWIRDRPFGQP